MMLHSLSGVQTIMKYLLLLTFVAFACAAPEAEPNAVAEADPKAEADPWYGYYGGYYGYRHYGYGYPYFYYGRKKREAEAAPTPEANAEADPWYGYYGHYGYYPYYRYGYLYGRKRKKTAILVNTCTVHPCIVHLYSLS